MVYRRKSYEDGCFGGTPFLETPIFGFSNGVMRRDYLVADETPISATCVS